MEKRQTAPAPPAVLSVLHFPPLEAGGYLDQATFHARYEAMSPDFRAELIGGVVFVPSPLRKAHGRHHALVMGWLTHYWIATPGTETMDNATAILGDDSEPQPDAALVIDSESGGQSSLSDDGYATGPPELIVEVASSSESIDLHASLVPAAAMAVEDAHGGHEIDLVGTSCHRWHEKHDGVVPARGR